MQQLIRRILPSVVILLGLVPTTQALEVRETLQFRIIKILPPNEVVVNRGVEDDIREGEQVRVTQGGKFKTRMLCLEVGQQTSLWKVFRVPKDRHLVKNRSYSMKLMPVSDVPPEKLALTLRPWKRLGSDFDEKTWIQTEKWSNHKKLEKKVGRRLPMAKAFKRKPNQVIEDFQNKKRFENDLGKFNKRLYITPFTYSRQNNMLNLLWGVDLRNSEFAKYQLGFNFEHSRQAVDTDIGEADFLLKTNAATLEYKVKNFSKNRDVFSSLRWSDMTLGAIKPIRSRFLLIPLGLKQKIAHSVRVKEFSFSYAPMIETRRTEKYTNGDTSVPAVSQANTQFRHFVGVDFVFKIAESWSLGTHLSAAPVHDVNAMDIQWNNANLLSKLALSNQVSKSLALNFQWVYDVSEQRRLDTNLEETNSQYALTLNYNL